MQAFKKQIIKLIIATIWMTILTVFVIHKDFTVDTLFTLQEVAPRTVSVAENTTCSARNNVFFLKLHKCASTSLQNIFHRYGLKHNLSFLLPRFGHFFAPLNVPFHVEIVKHLPWHYRGYNISAQHMKFDRAAIRSVMPPNTVFVTALRYPPHVYRSSYFYNNRQTTVNFEDYVMSKAFLKETVVGPLAKNSMLYDMGLNESQLLSIDSVQQRIMEADEEFSLVMMVERFDESLILLKHILCWKTEDVLTIKLNPSSSVMAADRFDVNSRLELNLAADMILYNHFLQVFEKKVQEFGVERMKQEVTELRSMRKLVMNQCQIKKFTKKDNPDSRFTMPVDNVYSYYPKLNSDLCQKMVLPEIAFTSLLREHQDISGLNYDQYVE